MNITDVQARIARLDQLARGIESELTTRKEDKERMPMFTCEDYTAGLTAAVEAIDKARRALQRAVNHWEDAGYRRRAKRRRGG